MRWLEIKIRLTQQQAGFNLQWSLLSVTFSSSSFPFTLILSKLTIEFSTFLAQLAKLTNFCKGSIFSGPNTKIQMISTIASEFVEHEANYNYRTQTYWVMMYQMQILRKYLHLIRVTNLLLWKWKPICEKGGDYKHFFDSLRIHSSSGTILRSKQTLCFYI